MELPLVVGVDGSESSLRATDWAVDEAARRGVSLRLVYASLWERYEGAMPPYSPGRPCEQVLAENIIDTAVERARLRDPHVKVSAAVLHQEAVTALLDEGRNALALVTGVRGRGELKSLLLGSVSLAVAARAHCPVIVVRGDPVIVVRGDKAGVAGAHERIVLGVGAAGAGSAAVEFAFREAEIRHCALDAVRAWRCPAHETTDHPLLAGEPDRYHEEQASLRLDEALHEAEQAHPGVRVRRLVVEGPPRHVLLERSAVADLLIVGARRRTGHFGLQLSRAGHALLHHAACPVAVVPQRA
ncbi:universal stress protein [Streptomyces sp. NPDC050617]|uniref:universal stress protein n=1 Tax=Streptomyces sp. NPDC050617 TaxID=3154628 RepID=UPI00343BCB2A